MSCTSKKAGQVLVKTVDKYVYRIPSAGWWITSFKHQSARTRADGQWDTNKMADALMFPLSLLGLYCACLHTHIHNPFFKTVLRNCTALQN